MSKVEFYRGATLIATVTAAPYNATDANVAAGSYSYTAKAYDNLNAVTVSAAVNVVVNAAPTVTLTAPANNTMFAAPATVSLTATAVDSGGTITRVEFYRGATLINTNTSAPYSYADLNVAAGNYAYTAKAYDNMGSVTTSAAVNVTVGGAAIFYIYTDQLNTPRAITNAQGSMVWKWDNVDPFGNNAPNENPSGLGNFTCNLRFPGQYFDKETNTHYNYMRDYDPTIGRYVQSDPIGLKGGINTYAYVGSNPLSFTDPKGEQIFDSYAALQNSWASQPPREPPPFWPGGTAPSVNELCVLTTICVGAAGGAAIFHNLPGMVLGALIGGAVGVVGCTPDPKPPSPPPDPSRPPFYPPPPP